MLTEKQIEDVFEQYYEYLIEKGLAFKARQFKLENNLRIDLLFQDKNEKNVVVELKRDVVSREDVGQLIQYAGTVPNSRVILIAPHIASSIKKAFEHYGIEYLEFSITKIEEMYKNLKQKNIQLKEKLNITLSKDVIKEPLLNRTLKDGNIAFKMNFNDKNWTGICSEDIYNFNAFSKQKKYWCSNEENNCQDWVDYDLDIDNNPCYESIALKCLGFTPGWNHGQERPYTCLEAKKGKIALFTSREPGSEEKDRFIFAVMLIDKIIPFDESKQGLEYYYGDKKKSIVLNKKNYIMFWDHYSNPNAPDIITWGSGLFRYINDSVIRSILEEIIKSNKYTAIEKNKAKNLIQMY